jgi:formyltetrahydrofolate-dependent phosphoribosylglycinamide formyltransferase
MVTYKKIAVMISGRGSNMNAIMAASMDPDYPARIIGVVSNRPNAAGLEIAEKNGIATKAIDHKTYDLREEHEAAITKVLEEMAPDLVVLAGYMRILSSTFVNRWRGKLINIHPSLLPSFRGLDTHERALIAGVKVHGCSVHYVTAELDDGPIIAQAAVPVLPDDTADTLQARVLKAEHFLYPKAVAMIASGEVRHSADNAIFNLAEPIDNEAMLLSPMK